MTEKEKKELAEEVKQGFHKIAENDGKAFTMKLKNMKLKSSYTYDKNQLPIG